MQIYYLLIVTLLIIYMIINKIQYKLDFNKKMVFVLISCILLIIISSFRSNSIGADMDVYLQIFESSKNKSMIDIISSGLSLDHFLSSEMYNGFYETGYILFNKMVSIISDSDFAFKLSCSLFVNIPVCFMIYKYSKDELMSMLLFILLGYYTQSFVIIRQYMALSMIIIALHFLIESEDAKFYTFVFIAFLFHKTAIVFLIVKLLKSYWDIIIKYIKFICIALSILFVLANPILKFFIMNFYPFYSDKIVFGEGLNLLIFMLIILLFSLYIGKKNGYDLKKFDAFFVLVVVGVVIQLFTVHFSLLNRLALYFQFFMIIYIPNSLSFIKKYKFLTNFIVLFVFLLYFSYLLIFNDSGQVKNYEMLFKYNIVLINESIKG